MSRRMILRRLNRLEGFVLKPDRSPDYIAIEVRDMRALPEGVDHLAHMIGPTHVFIGGRRVERAPGEAPDALCLRAAGLHPCADPEGVPVVFIHRSYSYLEARQ